MQDALSETDGRLAQNILHFARALRKAGVNVGTSQVQNAVQAVEAAGFTSREDFFYALRATLVSQPEHLQVFSQVFKMFWRDPEFLEKMMRLVLPLMQVREPEKPKPKPGERRAAEALWEQGQGNLEPPVLEELEVDAQFSWSENEVLRKLDFEQMSVAERKEAERAIRTLRLPAKAVRTRRYQSPANRGTPDIREILRRSLRKGGEIDRLSLKARRVRPPDLVAICDISGSMSQYSRMMLHFLHSLTWAANSGWGQIHSFTFGTQLTNITRALHKQDVDMALEAAGQDAPDWQGGTRIGEALRTFNRDWSRRVLGRGAVVLLVTDGLERGDVEELRTQAQRLSRSCRSLVWLNPLLRYDEFAPLAAGVRAMIPVVDVFHSCHSLDSLMDLSKTLSAPRDVLTAGSTAPD